ncbi:autophagy-related 18a isoform e [Anaeramoeba ignava]|uniref:Autophagy-related 18a isoform e n=1 Tax=Anaeramoeba ignava TaxID=1746090 RepID=A0A9Q0LC65_ANAIG|nr:autophagy-related 18a isoform e [Anaeramoeba ignava]
MDLKKFDRKKKKIHPKLLYMNIDTLHSQIIIGTEKGIKLFDIKPFSKVFSVKGTTFSIVELMYSSFLSLVGQGDPPTMSPRRVFFYNYKEDKNYEGIMLEEGIISLKQNKERFVVITSKKIHIYELPDLKKLETLDCSNEKGLCDLSREKSILAYPSVENAGNLELYDTLARKPMKTIKCHKSAISSIAFNSQGTLLATTSEKGTIIRIFDMNHLEKRKYKFRRGTTNAKIYNMAFSSKSRFLCLTSNRPTVHIFKIPINEKADKSTLDSIISNTFDLGRSFASISINSNSPHLCGFLFSNFESLDNDFLNDKFEKDEENSVVLLSAEGIVYIYTFDPKKGGKCKLESQNMLFKK